MAARYHVNPETGKPGECRAKVPQKCKYYSPKTGPVPHYATALEAQQGYEREMQEREKVIAEQEKAISKGAPRAILPTTHQDLQTDAFIPLENNPDPETIDALLHYHYYMNEYSNRMVTLENGDQVSWSSVQKEKALEKLQHTQYGKHYEGFSLSDGWMRPSTVYQSIPLEEVSLDAAEKRKAEKLREDGGVRVSPPYGNEENRQYLIDSRAFLQQLTPQEHAVVSYWTGCGSSVAATIVYDTPNPWGIQHEDPWDDDYVDGEKYMSTLDSALSKAELPQRKVIYRGLHNTSFGNASPEIKALEKESLKPPEERTLTREWVRREYPVGKELSFEMPASGTESSEVAQRFTDTNIVYEIDTHCAAAVGGTSAWTLSEREYLLPRATKYRVRKVLEGVPYAREGKNGASKLMTVIQLEQL